MFGSREKHLSKLSHNLRLRTGMVKRKTLADEGTLIHRSLADSHCKGGGSPASQRSSVVSASCSSARGTGATDDTTDTSGSTSASMPEHVETNDAPLPEDPESSSAETETQKDLVLAQHEAIDNARRSEEEIARAIEGNRIVLLRRLSRATLSGKLTLINLSRRGLKPEDAVLLKQAIMENQLLSVLKLGYNELGDEGTATLASGFVRDGVHHRSLSVLDLGFNKIGDEGVSALCEKALTGNEVIHTLYLSGNNIGESGALALSGSIGEDCRVACLHLFANPIGPAGLLSLARSIAEAEARSNAKAGAITSTGDSSLSTTDELERPRTVKELYLGDTGMGVQGFSSVASMLLTNLAIRVLSLSHNAIDDQGMGLLAQAVTTNKGLPLEVLQLSFNEITCAGVECFMNAIWGSQYLRELRLDNNRIRDRGAQLAAVGLSSIDLQVLDLGFNRITTVGIKALMKSVSESTSITTLSLSGISLDSNSCKAIKYALAYTKSLLSLYMDNCHIGYASQRHVVAGIVSNRSPPLRVLTGFQLGTICVTLGMPQVLETWANDQVLRFIQIMWEHARQQLPHQHSAPQLLRHARKRSRETYVSASADPSSGEDSSSGTMGPAPPAAVVAVAKRAMATIGEESGPMLRTEPHERCFTETAQFVPANATLLERSESGTVQALLPTIEEEMHDGEPVRLVELWNEAKKPSSEGEPPSHNTSLGLSHDPERKSTNLAWLREHFGSLNEVARLPFNNGDLWLLHQYFFSPVTETSPHYDQAESPLTSSSSEDKTGDRMISASRKHDELKRPSRTPQPSPHIGPSQPNSAQMGRTPSFQSLGQAALVAGVTNMATLKRQSWLMLEEEEKQSSSEEQGPAAKRAKNFKPRIAYYPRIREKLHALGTRPSQEQILSLLRQLKFVENVIFQDRNVYLDSNANRDPGLPTTEDVEMIVLDLL